MEIERVLPTVKIIIENLAIYAYPNQRFFQKKYNWNTPPHIHPFYELLISFDGNMTVKSDNMTLPFDIYDMCIIPPYYYHTVINKNPETQRLAMQFTFQKVPKTEGADFGNIDMYELFCGKLSSLDMLYQLNIDKNVMRFLFDSINREEDIYYYYRITTAINLMWLEVCKAVNASDIQVRDNLTSRFMYDKPPEYYMKVAVLEKNITDYLNKKITMTELSKMMNYSKKQTYRIIKEIYGMPIKTMIYERRMRMAMFLIRDTRASVADIAKFLKYGSEKSFSVMFGKRYHISPEKQRKIFAYKGYTSYYDKITTCGELEKIYGEDYC